jgi:hypothetical protein
MNNDPLPGCGVPDRTIIPSAARWSNHILKNCVRIPQPRSQDGVRSERISGRAKIKLDRTLRTSL